MSEPNIQEVNSQSKPIDIWLTNLSEINDGLRDAYTELLSPPELERFKRFLVEDARDQYLVARALLRTVLSRYADVPAQAWTFDTNQYGKPHISSPENCTSLQFNLSHTKGIVACAINRDYKLGVDVENTQRNFDHLIFDSELFAPAEVSGFNQVPTLERRQYFYSIWTLKEAYVKATGMGFSIPLNAFWFNLEEEVPRILFADRHDDHPSRWQFLCFDPTPNHKLALAVETSSNQQIAAALHWVVPLASITL